MGKGTIIDELGEGRYTVSIEMDVSGLQARRDRLLVDIFDLVQQYNLYLVRVEETETALVEAADAYNVAIDAYNNLPEEERDIAVLEDSIVALRAAETERDFAVQTAATIAAQRASKVVEVQNIDAVPPNPTVEAVCVDGETEITGEVGLIEIAHEAAVDPNNPTGFFSPTWVKPGFEGAAAYEGPADGILAWRRTQTPEQVFVNAALLPGVQKWKPTYRTGWITLLIDDTCFVSLDAANSSALWMGVNQTDTLENVPIVYRDCHGAAFQVGDHVVVQFTNQDWEQPRVIGFVENPRPCFSGPYLQVATPFEGFNLGDFILASREVSRQLRWDLSGLGAGGAATGFATFNGMLSSGTIASCIAAGKSSVAGAVLEAEYGSRIRGTATRLVNDSGRIESIIDIVEVGPVLSIDRIISVCHNADEVFILWMAANTNANFISVHDHGGVELRRMALNAGFGMGSMDGTELRGFAGTSRSWTQSLWFGDKLYISGPTASDETTTMIRMLCLRVDDGVPIWSRQFQVPRAAEVDISVSSDYLFSVYSVNPVRWGSYPDYWTGPPIIAYQELYQRSALTGDLLRTYNLGEMTPYTAFHATGVAYTHDYVYVSGWARGAYTLWSENEPVVAMFKVNKELQGALEFVRVRAMNSPELLGPPPSWNDEQEDTRGHIQNLYFGHKMYADTVETYRRAR